MAMGLTLTVGSVSAAGELHIYNWGNYTNPEMIEKFEKMHGVKVTIDGYDSNETMLAKVEQGGSGYDIVVPGDYMIAIMIKKGLLERVEPNKMSNFKNIDKKWVDVYWDEGRNYSIPYQWGTTNFTVDSTVYKGDVNTLALLFDPPAELKGRINMLKDMNDVINAGLRYLNYPRCHRAGTAPPSVHARTAPNWFTPIRKKASPAGWITSRYSRVRQISKTRNYS
jgi:spermidine/putrescine transport system substrate-binding protein